MVFKENFVAVIMADGKILREHDGSVELSFGSDYSIRLKNLESRKARVRISIDSEDVLKGHSLILDPNSHVDLEGFMDGHTVRKRFRFIQKTQEIVEHRGDKVDDGIVRVEYCFEQRRSGHVSIRYDPWPDHYWNDWIWTCPATPQPPYIVTYDSGTAGSVHKAYEVTCDAVDAGMTSRSAYNAVSSSRLNSTPKTDEGITVPGGETFQQFDHGHIGATDQPHVITIRLCGTTNSGAVIEKPVGTRDKSTCPTCGRKSSTNHRFCGNCGTNLR